jgi:hypothetical protein
LRETSGAQLAVKPIAAAATRDGERILRLYLPLHQLTLY